MATAADAEVVLRLYELRQEETLRTARKFIGVEFQAEDDLEELRAVSRAWDEGECLLAAGDRATGRWRLRWCCGARWMRILFLDSSGRGDLSVCEVPHWHAETEKESGNPFMRNTATLIETISGGEGGL